MASDSELSALTAADLICGSVVGLAGAAVRSVILHGSLATVVREADAGDAAGIDLHVVTVMAACTPTRAPALELYLGRHGRSPTALEVERRVAASADLASELSMALADGRALTGASPHEVIAPVPAEWIVDRGRHWLTTWRSLIGDADNAAFMVLTACRIWRFALEEVHCSKPRAAQWALDRDPSLTVVRQAVQQHEHDPTTPVSEQGIADLLDTVLRETTAGPADSRPSR